MKVLKSSYLDEENDLLLLDFVMYGFPFLIAVSACCDVGMFTPEQEDSLAQPLLKQAKALNITNGGCMDDLYNALVLQTDFYSQVNFRTYGFRLRWNTIKSTGRASLGGTRLCIEINAQEKESIYFTYKGARRIAFRMLLGQTWYQDSTAVIIHRDTLFPGMGADKVYNLYIQSHVIHRFKERIDIFGATERNYILKYALTEGQQSVKCSDGQRMLACTVNGAVIGYFPFIVQGDKLFAISFLPIVDSSVPEGEKLAQLLQLSKKDLIYLGMDKLSFYMSVDFDQIPVLKEALIASGIWEMAEMLANSCRPEREGEVQPMITPAIKKFFENS
jgi:hypothetical protein